MTSPFKLHMQRAKARQDQARLADKQPYKPETAHLSLFNARHTLDTMLLGLNEDLKRLHDLPNLDSRRELKIGELLPRYEPYVQEYRASGLQLDNPIVGWVLVWYLDTYQFEAAFELAEFMLAKGQKMPERFSRDVPATVADEVLRWADAEQKTGRSVEPYVSQLLTKATTPGSPWQIHEELQAKLFKVLGLYQFDTRQYQLAIESFTKAQGLYPKVGVTTKLREASKALTRLISEHGGDDAATPDEAEPVANGETAEQVQDAAQPAAQLGEDETAEEPNSAATVVTDQAEPKQAKAKDIPTQPNVKQGHKATSKARAKKA